MRENPSSPPFPNGEDSLQKRPLSLKKGGRGDFFSVCLFALLVLAGLLIFLHKSSEKYKIEASNGLVWRDGASLHLRMKSGGELVLTSRIQCGDVPCPEEVATQFTYAGWEGHGGAYRLRIHPSYDGIMLLTFSDDVPALLTSEAFSHEDLVPLPTLTSKFSGKDMLYAKWLDDMVAERTVVEAPLMKGDAYRENGALWLTIDGGKKMRLDDDLSCGDFACPQPLLRLFEFMDGNQKSWKIRMRQDESDVVLLIDRYAHPFGKGGQGGFFDDY